MATIYVRNVPDELHRKVRNVASKKKRSLGAEIIVLLEEGLKQESLQEQRLEALQSLAEVRKNYKSIPGEADSVTLIREDRDR